MDYQLLVDLFPFLAGHLKPCWPQIYIYYSLIPLVIRTRRRNLRHPGIFFESSTEFSSDHAYSYDILEVCSF